MDKVATVRRSTRLAAKEKGAFVSMKDRAVRIKALRLDTAHASISLARAIEASRILLDPAAHVASALSLADVARACGADPGEASSVAEAEPEEEESDGEP